MPAADPVAQRVAAFYKSSSALPTAVIAAGEHEFMNGTARRPAVVFSLAGPIGEARAGARSPQAALCRVDRGAVGVGGRVLGMRELGKPISTWRPPPGRGRASSVAWCAAATAWTIESPRPRPLVPFVRSLSSRWNGWKSRSSSFGGIVGPVFSMVSRARPARVSVLTSMRPLGRVVPDGVRDEVRDETLEQARVAGRCGRLEPGRDRQALVVDRSRASRVIASRSTGSWRSRPRWLRERVSSASISRSCCSPAASTCSPICAERRRCRRPGRRARPRPVCVPA